MENDMRCMTTAALDEVCAGAVTALKQLLEVGNFLLTDSEVSVLYRALNIADELPSVDR